MLIPHVSRSLERHAPRDDVEYLLTFARMLLTIIIAAAALVYIARGGRLMTLAPTA